MRADLHLRPRRHRRRAGRACGGGAGGAGGRADGAVRRESRRRRADLSRHHRRLPWAIARSWATTIGRALRSSAEVKASGATIVNGATVWSLDPTLLVGVSIAGQARLLQAKRVIVATGSLERPFPDCGLDVARRHDGRGGPDRPEGARPRAGRPHRDGRGQGRCSGCWRRSCCAPAPGSRRSSTRCRG